MAANGEVEKKNVFSFLHLGIRIFYFAAPDAATGAKSITVPSLRLQEQELIFLHEPCAVTCSHALAKTATSSVTVKAALRLMVYLRVIIEVQ